MAYLHEWYHYQTYKGAEADCSYSWSKRVISDILGAYVHLKQPSGPSSVGDVSRVFLAPLLGNLKEYFTLGSMLDKRQRRWSNNEPTLV